VPGDAPGQADVLASAGLDGTVRLWDTTTGLARGEPLVRSAEAVSGLAPCAAAIGDCVSLRGDGTVRIWAAATATERAVMSGPDVTAIATLSAPGQASLLTGDSYGRVQVSDLRTGHRRCSPVQVDDRAVLALCPLPGPSAAVRAAVAGGSGEFTIITVLPGGELQTGPVLPGWFGLIRSLCLITYPSGRTLLAAAGNQASIWVLDLDGGRSLTPAKNPLTGHVGRIWSLAAVPPSPGRSPRLASAGADHTVRLWDPAAGRALGRPLTGHTDQVRAVIAASSDDGHIVLVSGGHDGTIRLWDPVTGAAGAVIPIGIPVHALLQQRPDRPSLEGTGGGATIVVGLRTGILTLDLHRDLFLNE
jgi:WD40 repeat protein